MSKEKLPAKQEQKPAPIDIWAEVKSLRQKFAELSQEVSAAKRVILQLLQKLSTQKSNVIRLLQDGEPQEAIVESQFVKMTKAEIAAAEQTLMLVLSRKPSLLDEHRECISAIRAEIPLRQAEVDAKKKWMLDAENCKNNLIGLLGQIHALSPLTPSEIKVALEDNVSTGPDCWPSKKDTSDD